MPLIVRRATMSWLLVLLALLIGAGVVAVLATTAPARGPASAGSAAGGMTVPGPGLVEASRVAGPSAGLGTSPTIDPSPGQPPHQRRPTYAGAISRLDDGVDEMRSRIATDPHSWMDWSSLAAVYRQRGILSGDMTDFAAAADALQHAFSIAGPGSGPFLIRAQLNSTLHRYPLIEGDLRSAERSLLIDERERAAIDGLRGDLAFYAGRYPEARRWYEQGVRDHRDAVRLAALAQWHACTGDVTTARTLMDAALHLVDGEDPVGRAWCAAERGWMERNAGDDQQAMAWYLQAEEALPGWWMARFRAAEVQARTSHLDQAITTDQALVEQTGKPECMDALCLALRRAGRPQEAQHWAQVADLLYARMLIDTPEAAAGHALDHMLTVAAPGPLVVTLALRNAALRPGGEAMTKLARAYLETGQLALAARTIGTVLSTPWDTPELHLVAAAILAREGDGPGSQRQRTLMLVAGLGL